MFAENSDFNRAQEVLFKLPLAVLAENEHRQISFANQYFCDLFAIEAEPQMLTGMDCSNLAEESKGYFKDPDAFVRFINQAISVHAPILDFELQLLNGTYLAANYVPYFKQDNFAGHIWTYKNITLRKEAEIALENQKAFFAEILDSLPADVAIFDKEHKYIYTNYTAIKNPEIREWIKGKDDFDYCAYRNRDPEMAVIRRNKFLETIRVGKQIEWEDQLENTEGGIDHILRKLNPLFDEKGDLKYMVGYGININQIKQQAEELRLSEVRYKTVVNQLQEIIFRLNNEGIIEFLNPAWEKITGFSISQSLGKKISEFTDPAYSEQIQSNINLLAQGKLPEMFSMLKLNTRSKVGIYLEVYASVLEVDNGPKAIWGTFTNVTEKKKAENELLKTIQKERELNELKSGFVNMVSHEIRTPMAGILSSVELLELIGNGDIVQVKAKSQKHFERIKSQIKRVTELMNDVLLLGKIDAGKVQYHPETVNVLHLVKEIIQQSFNSKESKRKVTVEVDGDQRLSRLDASLFKHIVSNLLSNAIKYSLDRPDPIIRISFEKSTIQLEVIDFGIGIPAAEQKNLFSAFMRASNTKNIEGTGLGLVVVKHFIDMHKGKISFKSKEHEGTSFKVTFPG